MLRISLSLEHTIYHTILNLRIKIKPVSAKSAGFLTRYYSTVQYVSPKVRYKNAGTCLVFVMNCSDKWCLLGPLIKLEYNVFFLVFRYYAIARPLDYHETMTGMEDCWFFKNVAICNRKPFTCSEQVDYPQDLFSKYFCGGGGNLLLTLPFPIFDPVHAQLICLFQYRWTAVYLNSCLPGNRITDEKKSSYLNSLLPNSFWYHSIMVSALAPCLS